MKENDLAHGEFGKWLVNININPRHAQRFIKIYEELPLNASSVSYLGVNALYQLATMPEEQR